MDMKLIKDIKICEVGLRDGLQNEKTIIKTDDKVELVNRLTEAGVSVIEVGSFVSPKAVPQMADTDEVFKRISKKPGVEYRALIANSKGIERAASCGCEKVKLNVSASVAHNLANLNCTPAESVKGFAKCVDMANEFNIDISGSISMAFGSPWDKEIPLSIVKEIVEAYIAVGISEISLSDASGMAYPSQVYEICTIMKKTYPNINWWLHFHNTRGLGIANILSGMEAGFKQYDTSFAGVGGCPFVPGAAGNVSTEDVLHMCSEMGINSNVDLDKIIDIGRMVTRLVNHNTDSYILKAGKTKDLLSEIPTKQIKNQTLNK